MPSEYYLVCPKKLLKGYLYQEDRDYFSKPVGVELLSCNIHTRLLTVRDPVRDHTYPACKENIRFWASLSNKQLAAAGHFSTT